MNNDSILRARKDSVLSSIDIVELIGQTVALKRQGKDFIGLCPFHQERTPSFHVSPSKRFFHCFGCNANGNAIDFVMKRDRIDFASALRRLGGGGWRMSPPARARTRAGAGRGTRRAPR
jgi:DNA primase catalytic core